MRIGIIDYGAGNLQSVRNALHFLGYDPLWIRDASDLAALSSGAAPASPADLSSFIPHPSSYLSALVFPGQGEFGGCMESLRERELLDPLRAWLASGRPYFGICLGYQVLFDSSEEAPGIPGLGVFEGQVIRFTPERLAQSTIENRKSEIYKIPHMGWNELLPADPADPLWEGLPPRPHAYFVHSYYPVPADRALIATKTSYGAVEFASSIRSGARIATQFHPEKSQEVGLTILKNFLDHLLVRTN